MKEVCAKLRKKSVQCKPHRGKWPQCVPLSAIRHPAGHIFSPERLKPQRESSPSANYSLPLHKLSSAQVTLAHGRKIHHPHTDFGFKLAKFSPTELKLNEDSMNAYRDIINAINTAKKDGFAEGEAKGLVKGRAEGRAEGLAEGEAKGIEKVARKMLQRGKTIDEVSELTGLPTDLLRQLV